MYNNTNQSSDPTTRGESYAVFYIVACVLNALFSLTAFVGNFLVLGAIWRTPTIHQPTNILLFGLSLSEMGVGLIIQPFFIAVVTYEVSTGRYPSDLWIFRTIQAVFFSASILTLTSVSIERCLALLLHVKYVAMVTVRKTIIVLCLIWVTSVVYALTVISGGEPHRILAIFLSALCTVVNILTCTMVFCILRRHQIQIQIQAQVQQDSEAFNATRYRKSAFILVVLLILLVLCYFPFICARVVVNSTGWSAPRKRFVLRLTSSLVYLNSTLNLVVYCLCMREIRTAMIQFWKTVFRCNAIQNHVLLYKKGVN